MDTLVSRKLFRNKEQGIFYWDSVNRIKVNHYFREIIEREIFLKRYFVLVFFENLVKLNLFEYIEIYYNKILNLAV